MRVVRIVRRRKKAERVVKDWVQACSLVGTIDGLLGGYAYTLLVIYFLQSVEVPVLPNLQAMAGDSGPWVSDFGEDVEFSTAFATGAGWRSENVWSVGELVIRFFQFYAWEFSWSAAQIAGTMLSNIGSALRCMKYRRPPSCGTSCELLVSVILGRCGRSPCGWRRRVSTC